MRVAYFYLMKPDPEHVRAVAPDHALYWEALELPGYQGGPLGDRAGGLITFEAASIDEAERLADGDPFERCRLLERRWVMEWARTR